MIKEPLSMIKFEIIKSNDGSDTLRNSILDETYHSTYGAIQEAMHVFIDAGLQYLIAQTQIEHIKILEIGFGTGLNAFLTFDTIGKFENLSIDYETYEKYPIPLDVISKLNYLQKIKQSDMLLKMHQTDWEIKNQITKQFSFTKKQVDLLEHQEKKCFHLIYFDAFSPTKQPELWSLDILKKMFDNLEPNGVLVTYCAKGKVRRDLQASGFSVERIPGPPGKREMLRATKPEIIQQ